MTTPGSTPNTPQDEVLDVFTSPDQPDTPLTTAEVADHLDRPETEVENRLGALGDSGHVRSRQVDGPTRIWWPGNHAAPGPSMTGAQLEQFHRFIDAVRDAAIFTLDPDGLVQTWNTGAERIKGYQEEDVVGEHFSVFYTEEDRASDVPEENLAAAAEHGQVEDEGWRVRADGARFWANVVITAIRDDEGTLQGFTKVTRDLTERREHEQRLKWERDLGEQIIETVPVSIVVLTGDGRIHRANSRSLERLGIAEDDLERVTASSWNLYDESGVEVPSSETPWVRVAETGEPVYDFRCQAELPDIGRRWLSINAALIETDEVTDDRVVLSVDDITGQVEREQALRRERNQTEQLLRTAPVAISVQDTSGETLLANDRAQEVLGLSEREIIEEPENLEEWAIYDADGEPLGSDETPSARVVATERPVFEEEIEIRKPSGERLWLSVNASPVFDTDGDLERVITAGEDITELKRRERQLERRKSDLETELSEILGRISDAFYALDDEWRFTHVNDRAEELLQHPREELLDETIWDVFPDASGTAVWDRFHEAIDTQEPVNFEYEYEDLEMWLEITVYPSETGLSVYFQDVTERKRREQELKRYRTIVETVNDGIYTVDPDGRFTMVNDTYAEMTGYPRDELLGAHVSLVIDSDVSERARDVQEELASGEQDRLLIEAEIRRADGGTVPAEAAFSLLPADDGYERVGVVRDLTERREQERRLEESERRYRTLVEHFPNGAVALFDEDLRYTAAGGKLLEEEDIDPAERIGVSIFELYPQDLIEEVGPYFEAALHGESGTFEVEYLGRHLFNQTLPVRDADDEVYAGMLVVQDITERVEYRKQLQESIEKLEESNERLEQFAYIASHDLQEPLRMVSSYLTLLDERYREELDGEAREFIDFAVDGAERMQTMVQGLLAYSRVDTDAEPLEPTDPEAAVENVLDDLQVQIAENDAEVSVGELPTVAADENQLEQVFQNLVSNAIKYRDDAPPRIEISAERKNGMCEFRVADNGIGIDQAYVDQIFEVFKRLHSSEKYPGTGIGLALCRKIVARHEGEIWVESEPGKGSTFYFTIPLADGPTD